jgi:SAM-dependent methyltransferase
MDPDFLQAVESLDMSPGRVLDLGCGLGTQPMELAARGWDAVGIDIAPQLVRRANDLALSKNLTARFYDADLYDPLAILSLAEGSEPSFYGGFDVVLDRGLFHSLFNVDSRVDGLIAQLYFFHVLYVLKKGGYLLLKVMDQAQFSNVASSLTKELVHCSKHTCFRKLQEELESWFDVQLDS